MCVDMMIDPNLNNQYFRNVFIYKLKLRNQRHIIERPAEQANGRDGMS